MIWFAFWMVVLTLVANKLTEEKKPKELTSKQKMEAWKKSVGWDE